MSIRTYHVRHTKVQRPHHTLHAVRDLGAGENFLKTSVSPKNFGGIPKLVCVQLRGVDQRLLPTFL